MTGVLCTVYGAQVYLKFKFNLNFKVFNDFLVLDETHIFILTKHTEIMSIG